MTDIKLVDPATGREVARGEAGEICVRGPQVMVGYLNRPAETRAAIDADGYMHTGDMALQDDEGYLKIVDRTKDMIIVGGYKVFSKRVEDVLSTHPAVGGIAIVGSANPERPGSEIITAYVTPVAQYTGDEQALRTEILGLARDRLAAYEVPRKVEVRSELPMTSVGKIDKRLLRAGN